MSSEDDDADAGPGYTNYPNPKAFSKSASRSSSHFYFDVNDDLDDVGNGGGAGGAAGGSNTLAAGDVSVRPKTMLLKRFPRPNSMGDMPRPSSIASSSDSRVLPPPVPKRGGGTIKRFFSKVFKKEKASTPPGSPYNPRKTKSSHDVQMLSEEDDEDPYLTVNDEEAAGYQPGAAAVTYTNRPFDRAGSRLCLDLDKVRLSSELYEDAVDNYAISGYDSDDFNDVYTDNTGAIVPVNPPHYENYESPYDEIPLRFHGATKIQAMPLPPIPVREDKQQQQHDDYMNASLMQPVVEPLPMLASSDEEPLTGEELDGYATCHDEHTFQPHSSTMLNISDGVYLDPSQCSISPPHTPPPLPLSPPPDLTPSPDSISPIPDRSPPSLAVTPPPLLPPRHSIPNSWTHSTFRQHGSSTTSTAAAATNSSIYSSINRHLKRGTSEPNMYAHRRPSPPLPVPNNSTTITAAAAASTATAVTNGSDDDGSEKAAPQVPSKSFGDLSEAFVPRNGSSHPLPLPPPPPPANSNHTAPPNPGENDDKQQSAPVFKMLNYSLHEKEEFV